MKLSTISTILEQGFGFEPSCSVRVVPSGNITVSYKSGVVAELIVPRTASKDELCDVLEQTYSSFRAA